MGVSYENRTINELADFTAETIAENPDDIEVFSRG